MGLLAGGGRVLGGVEEILALDVLVEGVVTGVDGLGVDGDVDRAGLGGLVENDLAAVLVEARLLGRVAEVAVREAREGVAAVGDIGFRRGKGRSVKTRGSDGESEGGELLFNALLLRVANCKFEVLF